MTPSLVRLMTPKKRLPNHVSRGFLGLLLLCGGCGYIGVQPGMPSAFDDWVVGESAEAGFDPAALDQLVLARCPFGAATASPAASLRI